MCWGGDTGLPLGQSASHTHTLVTPSIGRLRPTKTASSNSPVLVPRLPTHPSTETNSLLPQDLAREWEGAEVSGLPGEQGLTQHQRCRHPAWERGGRHSPHRCVPRTAREDRAVTLCSWQRSPLVRGVHSHVTCGPGTNAERASASQEEQGSHRESTGPRGSFLPHLPLNWRRHPW